MAHAARNEILTQAQNGQGLSKIPIIFLGHSLGGLVIKQALLNARDDPDNYLETWNATCGLVFFGTPHRGGNTGALEEFGVRFAKLFTNDSTANDLLMCLKPNSLFTQDSAERFSKQLKNFKILTFFETRPTKFHGFSKIVVNRDSAILNAPGEVCVDLDRNHRDICKFGERENGYDIVKASLSDIVARVLVPMREARLSSLQLLPGMNVNPDSTASVTWSQDTPQRHSQSTIKSCNSELASPTSSPFTIAEVEEMNDRFLEAVKALDALLIHNWIMDRDRRAHLKPELIQSALLDLAGLKEPTEERFQVEAGRFRDHAVCVILDECNSNLECLDDVLEATPLILAALCGREDITKLLIDAGGSLQARDGIYGRTPLSWAAKNNFIGTAEILLTALDNRQDQQTIQSKDIDGHTAFDLANRNGHKDMARLIGSRSTRSNASFTNGI
ncbi:hypothetical protein ACEPPN_018923 [Leptodophora sp. 'Broadleaf-Isolate-01']